MEEDKPNLVLSNRRVGVRLRQPILILTKSDTHMSDAKKNSQSNKHNKLQPIQNFAQNFINFFLGLGRMRNNEAFP
jgi:hypothetical protein